MGALEIKGVSAGYGSTAVLTELSLDVAQGSITAILGPSGSGKTTLLRVIAGFERATAGTVSVSGKLFEGPDTFVAPERRKLGYVAQDGALFPHLTVGRNVAFGLPRSVGRKARVAELLDMVGLKDYSGRYPHQLSGGQQQRVALARALANEPALILLDEPFAALDAALRNDVRRDIVEILRVAGTTAVLVTHDQDEALSMADQLAVLEGGRIKQVGAPSELYRRPVDPALAEFIGSTNILSGVIEPTGVRTALGLLPTEVAMPADGAVTVMVRPEQVEVLPVGAGPGVRARISAIEYHGHDALVTLLAKGAGGDFTLIARTGPDVCLEIGHEVSVSTAGAVHVWPAAS